jgi:nicotinamidase-related amidase
VNVATNALYLVCDMINDLVHEDGPNGKKGYGPVLARCKTVENTAVAIQKARAAGVKIGYVRVGFSTDYRECPPKSRIFQGAKKAGLFKLGTWGTEVHPLLAPKPEDFDIVKHRVSPFYATNLEPILRSNRIERLYISGVSTSGAVLSAAKEGHDRDYEIFVIDDCSAALTDEQHNSVIEQMQRMATITKSTSVTFTEVF